MANDLICDDDDIVFIDACYQRLEKHEKTKYKTFLVAMQPGKRKQLPKNSILSQVEYIKSQIRANVEHPYHWLKCIFGLKKLCYRGLYKMLKCYMPLVLEHCCPTIFQNSAS